jgi:dTDP-4-dehydrorhamnose reductase
MKIIVLGHKGMLGQMAVSYFEKKHHVVTTNLRFDYSSLDEWTNFMRQHDNSFIINCVGKIKQKSNDLNELVWVNTILPLTLAKVLLPSQILIQPSTDCVFSGKKLAPYAINDTPDATDFYGWSKHLGEIALKNNTQSIVIRTSIIGPDKCTSPKGLLGWFLDQPDGSVLKGFINHYWNGITTLEWCKVVDNFISKPNELQLPLFVQLGTYNYVTKYQMLLLFNEIFERKLYVEPYSSDEVIDRRLTPTLFVKSLRDQLSDLKFYHF